MAYEYPTCVTVLELASATTFENGATTTVLDNTEFAWRSAVPADWKVDVTKMLELRAASATTVPAAGGA